MKKTCSRGFSKAILFAFGDVFDAARVGNAVSMGRLAVKKAAWKFDVPAPVRRKFFHHRDGRAQRLLTLA
jgi:hypothetical protein